jgi:hypothetical protein
MLMQMASVPDAETIADAVNPPMIALNASLRISYTRIHASPNVHQVS